MMAESPTFDASEAGFQIGLEVGGADTRRGEQRLDVDDLAAMSSSAVSGQHVRDVRAAADEAVVGVHAPVEPHATVACRVHGDNLVTGALRVQLLLQAVVQR